MGFRDCKNFFREFAAKPRVIGAIAPSSRGLAASMVQWIDWSRVEAVVEYGPGTGVFTRSILSSMRSATKLLAIEINPKFAAALEGRFPTVRVVNDSVKNVKSLCAHEGIDRVDAIVCGLPWAAFSNQQQTELLEATMAVLKPGGVFATFAHLQGLLLPAGQRFRRKLPHYFSQTELSKTVWLNLPPSFVYRCRR